MGDNIEGSKSPGTYDEPSCDELYTRSAFIRRVIKGAVATGTLAATAAVVDSFLVPSVAAAASQACTESGANGYADTSQGGPDHIYNDGVQFVVQCIYYGNGNTLLGSDTPCSGNADAGLVCPNPE